MKKMYCKKNKKSINILTIILILIILGIHFMFKFFNDKAIPIFMEYSEIQTKKIISEVILNSISSKAINTKELFYTSSKGNIESFDLNTEYINTILNDVTKEVDKKLYELETKDSIFKLPSGIIFNNNILSNIFPKIPIKLDIIGNTLCVLNTKIESYGINNALFKLNIDITIDVKILMPFISKTTSIMVSTPIVIKLIEGNIPSYLLGGYYNNSFSN